jgi:hypothetical protein
VQGQISRNKEPKLAFRPYEIKVLTVDNGRNGLLGITEAASFTQVVTDDSVEAWWKFAEDFTTAGDCAGAPAGYNICDSGRHAHHGEPQNSPSWVAAGSGPSFASGDGAVLLNPTDDTSLQTIVIDQPLSDFTAITVEAEFSMLNSVLAHTLVTVGSSGDSTNFVFLRASNKVLGSSGNGSLAGDTTPLATDTIYHFSYTGTTSADEMVYYNGQSDLATAGTASDFSTYASSYREVYLGGLFNTTGGLLNGYLGDVVIYSRALSDVELANHGRFYTP